MRERETNLRNDGDFEMETKFLGSFEREGAELLVKQFERTRTLRTKRTRRHDAADTTDGDGGASQSIRTWGHGTTWTHQASSRGRVT